MSTCCDIPNPLVRDGASQSQRQAEALSPDYVRVDERDLADFLVFAHQLSRQVIYYDFDNLPHGDWQAFFASSTPVQIALIGKTNTQIVKDTYDRQLTVFLDDRTALSFDPLLATLTGLFDRLRDWYVGLEDYTPLKSRILGLVETNAIVPLTQLLELVLGMEVGLGTSAAIANFYERLGQFETAFDVVVDSGAVPADETLLTGTRFEAQTALDNVFQVLFQNYRQAVRLAPQFLVHSLEARSDHKSHLALYFAFLQVMDSAQADLNGIGQRHLDFFYRDVLQLPERQAIPDRAHLVFGLAKFVEEHKLEADLAFKGGKDDTGVELFYRLNEEILVHKAQVASLKGLFLNSQESASGTAPENLTGLHVSAVADSPDGEGGEFAKEDEVRAWLPFGDGDRARAALGLAIASDLLLLQEGGRTVQFSLILTGASTDLPPNRLHEIFKVYFSGEEDWIEGTVLQAGNVLSFSQLQRNILSSSQPQTSWDGTTLKLAVTLAADAEPVVGFHSELSGAALNTDRPVARLVLQDGVEIAGRSPYHYLRGAIVTDLSVKVVVDEVRTLVVQNELSVLDATKPFQPFGSQPKAGGILYIGSQEVFQKRLTALTLHIDQEGPGESFANYYAGYDLPTGFSPGDVSVQALRNKVWSPSSGVARDLFEASGNAQTSFTFGSAELASLGLNEAATTDPIAVWNFDSVNGFIRLSLNSDFLHDAYATMLARQVLASATNEIISVDSVDRRKAVIGAYYQKPPSGETSGDIFVATTYYVELTDTPIIPNEPFTPVVNALSLSYTAEASVTDCQLFHLHPFDGFVELTEFADTDIATNPEFLPTFDSEGELLIGISDLDAPIALPLLFQVAEETADTDLAQTDVSWFYLTQNQWLPFQQEDVVSDSTNGLIASGIVNLAIPSDITAGNTRLDPSLYWLKAAVTERQRAIPNIIGVHPQVAEVTFSDRGNDPARLATPLDAGAIAKLEVPQAQIKTITQLYPSSGGQVKEQPQHYYTRISEHLRHKGRATSIFDYERLVLETFPEIYKVRCINHARITPDDRLQELVPGHVTVALIPDLSQRQTTNDLEPKVNINLLAKIQAYLNGISSEWVELRVVNPRYEPIRAQFDVEFKSPFSANFSFYAQQLDRAIVGFLSPWTLDGGADIHFGGKVFRSSIINFAEEQPYVDRVINFQMHQGDRLDLKEVAASSARSILVSGSSHAITEIARPLPPNLPVPVR